MRRVDVDRMRRYARVPDPGPWPAIYIRHQDPEPDPEPMTWGERVWATVALVVGVYYLVIFALLAVGFVIGLSGLHVTPYGTDRHERVVKVPPWPWEATHDGVVKRRVSSYLSLDPGEALTWPVAAYRALT